MFSQCTLPMFEFFPFEKNVVVYLNKFDCLLAICVKAYRQNYSQITTTDKFEYPANSKRNMFMPNLIIYCKHGLT